MNDDYSPMKLDTRFKEAFKVALAFAMVYGIAPNLSWMKEIKPCGY